MKNEIEVSIIMPAYNASRYIKEAIESVYCQNVNWELIIIDDASKDDTEQIIQQFLEDERVVYIKNEHNLGVAISRNLGIQRAKGEYIAFLDADDRWVKGKLERQLELMKEKNGILCSTARALMNEAGELTGRVISVKEQITYRSLLYGNCISMSSAMVQREVALEFPMGQEHLHEDYIFWLQILEKYEVAYGINEPMLEYRVTLGSKSGNKLRSAAMTFGVYRYMGLNIFQSIYYFIGYAVNGVKKHFFS